MYFCQPSTTQMNRTAFIQNIIGLFGVAAIPKGLVTQYQKMYLLQCFVRGFRFHKGPELLEQITVGQMLELQREPENEHDDCAIALYMGKQKLGYIPREENEILSRLMDAQVVELLAEVTHVEPKAQSWENVHIAVYLLKEITDQPLPTQAAYLMEIENPHYRTLKTAGDRVTRVSYQQPKDVPVRNQINSADDFYLALEEHGKDNRIIGVIHDGFGHPGNMQQAVEESRLIINRNRLPEDLKMDEVLKALDNEIVQIDNSFHEDGYVIANIDRLAELASRIESFEETLDRAGRKFFAVVFNA
jgi:hypothetical protein